jgi:hypothetical protein
MYHGTTTVRQQVFSFSLPSNLPCPESIKEAASVVAYGLVKYYTGNNTGDTPGNLPDPYYCKS